MLKSHLHLAQNDRLYLQELVKKSSLSRRVYQRARALLCLDGGAEFARRGGLGVQHTAPGLCPLEPAPAGSARRGVGRGRGGLA